MKYDEEFQNDISDAIAGAIGRGLDEPTILVHLCRSIAAYQLTVRGVDSNAVSEAMKERAQK